MDVDKYLKKLRLLFQSLIEGKIVINENGLETLLTFLEDRNDNSPGKPILNTPGFADLISHVLKKNNTTNDSLKVFFIKIVTILFENDIQCTKMQIFQTLSTEVCVLANLNCSPSSSLYLATIKLATVQLTCKVALRFFIEHKVWRDILYPNIHHKPKQISNAAYNFMAKLVWQLAEGNLELELQEVLGYILEPILSSEYLSVPILDTETDSELSDILFPYLNTLLTVLTEGDNHLYVNEISTLLKEYFLVDHRLFDIFNTTKNSQLLKLLNACLFRYLLLLHRPLLYNNKMDEFCNKMAAFHRNCVGQTAKKRDGFGIVDYVTQSTIIWSHFEKTHAANLNLPLTFERNGQTLEFSLQIVAHLIMPMVKYSALYRFENKLELTDEIELYIRKMTKGLTEYIYSSCYVFGMLLEDSGTTYRIKVTIHTLKELLRLNGHLTQSQAGPLFQSLYYMLEVFIACDGRDVVVMSENPIDTEESIMLTHLLNAMKMLLKEHNIPWYENLEVVSVQSNLLNLLKQSSLTVKQLIQVLDLINICIKKFLSPNMSLLVESRSSQDSTLNEIGKVIKLYMQHEDWQVRDSALNILNTCTEVSFIKYIPLQEVITKNSLIILAVKAGLTDPEYYSQSAALKCLTAATKIDSIWHEVLVDNENISLHLVYLVRFHGEGMVRKEAINVLNGVYTNQKVTPRFRDTLYDVMLSAALDDTHGEVQVAALNFWKRAIHDHLTYRGMLDGKFPSVTFSKEKRKILVFNNAEIQRQLTAIMNHLSNIGCLAVLIECMNETHNIIVMDLAYSIAKELLEILDKYNFETSIENVKIESLDVAVNNKEEKNNTPMDLYCAISDDEKNKVIESILSVDQVELIINLCDNYRQNKLEEMDIDLAYNSRRKLVHPNTFLEYFRNIDFSSRIENKRNSNADYVYTLDQFLDELLNV